MLRGSKVLTSALCIMEIVCTADECLRTRLLSLCRQLGVLPLAQPRDILQRSIQACLSGANEMDWAVSPEDDGVSIAIAHPEKVDESAVQEARCWRHNQEQWYLSMHEVGRVDLQRVIQSLGAEEQTRLRRSRPSFVRTMIHQEPFVDDCVAEFLEAVGQKPNEPNIRAALQLESWRFFLAAQLIGLYDRSVNVFGNQKV